MKILHKMFCNNDPGMHVLTIRDVDSNPLFKCKVLARALGYSNTDEAIWRHIDDKSKK